VDAFRLELVIGFALLLLVGVPALVVRMLDARARTGPGATPLRSSGAAAALSATEDADADRRCPFCKDAIAAAAVHIECAACHTKHHASCFEENHGCAVHGCAEKRGVGRSR
jgi:hypothetical protein